MLQGRVSAALIFIGSQQTGLVPVNNEVIEDLKSKHPPSVEPVLESLIKGPLLTYRTYRQLLLLHKAGPSAYLTTPWRLISTPFQYRVRVCTGVSANRGSVRDFVQVVIVQVCLKSVQVLYQG